MTRAPNMADVAARAGVSHQTVSRVLNDFPGIRPSTKQRVLDAVAELGYRPNLLARALASNRSRSIGVLSPAIAFYGPTSVLHSVERATRAAGYHPLITVADDDEASISSSLDFLLSQTVEALVVIVPHRAILDVLEARRLDLPVVAFGSVDSDRVRSVAVDQGVGVGLGLDHLTGLGHRRIQHVAGPEGWADAQTRLSAFRSGIVAAGLPELPVVAADWTSDAGYAAASRLDSEATAVFCANDGLALGLVHGLADRGVRVPEDVSVVGFDNIPESAHALPPLTTVHQDFDTSGRIAVEEVVALLGGGSVPDERAVLPRLIVRASTAAPRAAPAAWG